MTKNILIVDDDPNIREVISFALDKASMKVISASDGQQALEAFNKSNPDLVILDITMPEKDGLEVCKEIRKTSDVPVLFLSSRDEEIDRVVGLEIGGDDYVTKPFSPRELVARVNAILKRTLAKPASEEKKLTHGNVRLEIEKHAAYWNDIPIDLTAIEFAVLQTFLQYPEKVYSRDDIMNGAYDYNINVSDRTIDSHIRNVRSKYRDVGCESVIETVHGVGYKLGSCK